MCIKVVQILRNMKISANIYTTSLIYVTISLKIEHLARKITLSMSSYFFFLEKIFNFFEFSLLRNFAKKDFFIKKYESFFESLHNFINFCNDFV